MQNTKNRFLSEVKNDYKIIKYTICTIEKAKDIIFIFCRNGSNYHLKCVWVCMQFRR